jgi:hypothetical protein
VLFGRIFPAGDGGKNRAIRSNLFYGFTVKKDLRFYPLRYSQPLRGRTFYEIFPLRAREQSDCIGNPIA